MFLIKIVSPTGAIAPVILEQAESINVFDALGSADEGVSFEIAKNAPKADILNPDNLGYVYFWEVWDTSTNERVNYGPIKNITESGTNWKVTGAGRSSLLDDIRSTNKTFYSAVDRFVDDLRYENIAIEPRTKTMVWSGENTTLDNLHEENSFDSPDFDDTYHTLSSRTKDFAIDDEVGYIPLGKVEPSRSFYVTKQYWSGTNPKDSLIVDLGDTYPISKVRVLFPWWGGKQRMTNRTYDFDLAYAVGVDRLTYSTSGLWNVWRHPVRGSDWTTFHSQTDNMLVTMANSPMTFNLGYTNSGEGYGFNIFNSATSHTGPIDVRFVRIAVKAVHAWYGTIYDDVPGHDGVNYQCDPEYAPGDDSFFGSRKGIMHNSTFNDRVLESANDCHAAVVEVGAFKEIVGKDRIKPLALQRIENNNLQIKYTHTCDPSETRSTTGTSYRRFEPGTFFRRITVTYSGASSNFTKFFTKDCTGCYPDGFHFGIQDSSQNLIYSTDNTSGTDIPIRAHMFCSYVLMRGASNAYVSSVDAWKGQTDSLSFGGSYSYSSTTGDTAAVTFRGESFKWYATIPTGKTAANVKIEIRHKIFGTRKGSAHIASTYWSAYTTLETSYQLPTGVSAQSVYEIEYGSSILDPDTTYEIKITNLDGGYCSIDSFEGYWAASLTMYNEDSTRLKVSDETAMHQIYDKRFSGGSMYKWNVAGKGVSWEFTGDRILVTGARGRNAGKLKLQIRERDNFSGMYDVGADDHIFIPGGDPTDGSLTLDEGTPKLGNESTQYLLFDSDDYFTAGLPWNTYTVSLQLKSPADTYTTTKNEVNSSNFLYRCRACKADASGAVDTNKFVYLDGIGLHETVGVSISYENTSNLTQLQDIAEALQSEWAVTDDGVVLDPRVGTDTDVVLREGTNTLVEFEVVHDISKVASILYSSGADIDGLPLFAITEDKISRDILGRTVMKDNDFREIADYQQLIGLSRAELRRRRYPEKRITVTHIGNLGLIPGDTFNLVTKKNGEMRVRIMKREISQSTSGITYSMECSIWPLIA